MTKQISHYHFHFVSSVCVPNQFFVLFLLLLVLLLMPSSMEYVQYIRIDRLIRWQSWFFLSRMLYDFTISQCSTNSNSMDLLAIDTNALLSFLWCFQMCDRYIEAVIRLSAVSGPDKQPITCTYVAEK